MPKSTELTIDGKQIAVTNLDKVLYPKAGFTKGEVIDYYIRAAPVLLPHLKDRALTMKRYPNGVEKEFFYEKRCPSFHPAWVKTAKIWSEQNQEKIPYCLANDLPTLVWTANLADLEMHTSLALSDQPDKPTSMVFDLDPGPGANILDCAAVALSLRKLLADAGLEVFPKTSGSKGLQLYVPLNTPVSFEKTKEYAHALADRLTREHPEKVLSQMSKDLRQDKVFIDWSQNDRHKTTICVYSLRAKEHPTVSTPLQWVEIEKALRTRKPASLVFEAAALLKRIDKLGDLFAPVLTLKQKLPGSL